MNTSRIRGRVLHAITLAVVTAIVASACSSGSGSKPDAGATSSSTTSAAPQEPSAKVCDVVSDDVVTAVLGVEIVRREPAGVQADSTFSCIKGLAVSDDSKSYTLVSVTMTREAGAALYESYIAGGTTPVSGVGDRAAYQPNAGTLFVLTGSDLLTIKVAKAGANGSQQDTVTVAEDVLSRP